MRRRRRRTILLIVLGVLLFLVISALLTRALSVGGAEDSAITELVTAEATGSAAVVANVHGLRATARRAGRGQRPTRPRSSAPARCRSSRSSSRPGSRSAAPRAPRGWRGSSGGSLPIVQCVRVRHAGNVLQGFTIELLVVSRRIKSDAACPSRF